MTIDSPAADELERASGAHFQRERPTEGDFTEIGSETASSLACPDAVMGMAPSGKAPNPQDREGPIRLRAIAVKRGRLVCEIAIPDEHRRYSTPGLAAFVVGRHPNIVHHACVNSVGSRFGDVIETTSVAHMLEHIAIDLQIRESQSPDACFVGTTEWLDEQMGMARIELSFVDDLTVLTAFNKAMRFLNNAVITCLL